MTPSHVPYFAHGGEGVRIEGYDDLRPIGRGGFGVVYRGRDRRFARDVAVKVLSGVLDDTMTARFERECHAVGALSGHPHIVVVHASGTTDEGLAYLVMELLSGGSLADRLAGAGPLSWPTAADLGVQLAGALETAHRGGVLHRDVKPENVLLSAYRQPKLVDFGIATVRGGFETKSASVSASLAHAAPEILAGKRSSTASDVYALGSTLFQVLVGRPAFLNPDDETLFPLLARISSEPVPDLRPHGVPDAVACVIERSMSKAPEDRYSTALDFGLALQQAAVEHGQVVSNPIVVGEDSAVAAAPVGAVTTHQAAITPPLPIASVAAAAPVQRRRRTPLVAGLAALALLAGAAAFVVLRGGDDTGRQPASFHFAEVADKTISLSRSWSLDPHGTLLSNDTTLTNPSATPVTRTVLEVIPKSVAADIKDVTFTPRDVTVVQADPVVRWTFHLAPGQVAHLRWTVTLGAVTSSAELDGMAADQRAAEQALVPGLPAIAAAARIPLAQLVPFAGSAVPDPGLTSSPAAKPAVSLSSSPVRTPDVPVTRTTDPAVVAPPVVTRSPAAVNRAPVLGAIASTKLDERTGYTLRFPGSDPDGDRLTYALSGTLPAGLTVSGSTVSGTVLVSAVSLTQTKTNLQSKVFSLRVTARDPSGASASRTFALTIRDTHISMPSYLGHYGCRGQTPCNDPPSLPNLSQISAPNFACLRDDSKESGTIAAQSVAPGTTFRWGGPVTWTYYGTVSGGCG